MGIYINPKDCEKEEWLIRHGSVIRGSDGLSRAPASHRNGDSLAVVLVANGGFTAAAIAFSDRELQVFAYDDGRPKVWLWVSIADLCEVTGLARELLLESADD